MSDTQWEDATRTTETVHQGRAIGLNAGYTTEYNIWSLADQSMPAGMRLSGHVLAEAKKTYQCLVAYS